MSAPTYAYRIVSEHPDGNGGTYTRTRRFFTSAAAHGSIDMMLVGSPRSGPFDAIPPATVVRVEIAPLEWQPVATYPRDEA